MLRKKTIDTSEKRAFNRIQEMNLNSYFENEQEEYLNEAQILFQLCVEPCSCLSFKHRLRTKEYRQSGRLSSRGYLNHRVHDY